MMSGGETVAGKTLGVCSGTWWFGLNGCERVETVWVLWEDGWLVVGNKGEVR